MPRKEYTKIEAPFTAKLKTWMKYNMKFTYGWEVKYPKEDKYYFSQDKSFKKEMINLLAWGRTFIYKFSDVGRMGTVHDGFTIWNEPAFFFFTWNGKDFYIIEVSTLDRFRNKNLFITQEDASKMAQYRSKLGEIIN